MNQATDAQNYRVKMVGVVQPNVLIRVVRLHQQEVPKEVLHVVQDILRVVMQRMIVSVLTIRKVGVINIKVNTH